MYFTSASLALWNSSLLIPIHCSTKTADGMRLGYG